MDSMFWNSLKTLVEPDELQALEPFLLFRWGVQTVLVISLFLSKEPRWQSSCIIFILQMPYWSFLSKIKLSWLQISVSPRTSVGVPSSLCNWTSGWHSKLNVCRPIPIFSSEWFLQPGHFCRHSKDFSFNFGKPLLSPHIQCQYWCWESQDQSEKRDRAPRYMKRKKQTLLWWSWQPIE